LHTLLISGPHLTNPEYSNGTDEEKRSCCGGWGFGGVQLMLIPQVTRRIKGILVSISMYVDPRNIQLELMTLLFCF
jgi:hypothetical protein